MEAKVINEGWQLQYLHITKNNDWQKKSVSYSGKMTFRNSKEDEINFNVPQDKMDQLLALISECVIDSAKEMGNRLVQSIVPPPQTAIENNPLE